MKDTSLMMDDAVHNQVLLKNQEDPFYLVDIEDFLAKHRNWQLNLPRVKPFYAVKCNDSRMVLGILVSRQK